MKYAEFAGLLKDRLDQRAVVDTSTTTRFALAHDASHFLNVPEVVVRPSSISDVQSILQTSRELSIPVTFRSGGTSLSGQASSSGALIDTRSMFNEIRVDQDANRITLGPGVTVRRANTALLRHGKKLGPDPASEIACTIGGVVANNSSGMCCGVHENSYQTVQAVKAVLPDGTLFDSSAPDASQKLASDSPAIFDGITTIRERIMSNPQSVETIERLFSMKNTMGYSLNSFLDYEDPADILSHLLVGSEGTLAWLGEVTFRTVDLPRHKATTLLIFESLHAAASALTQLIEAGAAAIELMDAVSLKVAQRDPDALEILAQLDVTTHAALLVEFQETSETALSDRIISADRALAEIDVHEALPLTTDTGIQATLWKIRKGLYTAVAGDRPSGTTALLEDIAVPVESLANTCTQLTSLFDEFGYVNSVIFGHAKDGNIHFMLTDDFASSSATTRFAEFTEKMVDLVLANGGTLKAEHGTGRVMAPFMAKQYGTELADVMWEVKRLFDPDLLLNPGVLVNSDSSDHLRNFKPVHEVEKEVDRCVECGYCEPLCPSKTLTLTPRQRIVLRREIAAAESAGNNELAQELIDEYDYSGIDTCAVDGMCQTACPVLINTGDLVKRLRIDRNGRALQRGWGAAATHWSSASRAISAGLSVAHSLPAFVPQVATTVGRKIFGDDILPQWTSDLPAGGGRRSDSPFLGAESSSFAGKSVIYLPSCQGAMYGPAEGSIGAQRSFEDLCKKAGITVFVPPEIDSMCCGTPWSSKGMRSGRETMSQRVLGILEQLAAAKPIIVVCDASSCTEGFVKTIAGANSERMQVMDGVTFVSKYLVPRIQEEWTAAKVESITIHPTCSTTHLGTTTDLVALAALSAEHVAIPDDWSCCGFAGDRGMLHPELTAAATKAEAANVAEANSVRHTSSNRACEIGMSRATDRTYYSILETYNESLRSAQPG